MIVKEKKGHQMLTYIGLMLITLLTLLPLIWMLSA
ncbi:MAG TPA: sugar ABC transporter ATP-binding protein, partial [Lachnoclostridium sp.]|nr:sugar ABC transporter ATP-binding protein [Lachnoclostridium sp.]